MNWSIERKLPLFVSALLVAVVLVLSGAAYREVRRAARSIATNRLERASTELAALFQRSTVQRLTEVRALAADRSVRDLVASRGQRGRDSALQAIRKIAAGAAPNVAIELWGPTGLLLRSGDATLSATPPLPPAPDSGVVSPLQIVRDTILFYQVRVPIRAGGRVAGQVVQLRRIGTSPEARRTIGQLIGGDIDLVMGNADGDPWTDLATVIPAPPAVVRSAHQPVPYDRTEPKFGMSAPIRSTPWMIIVDLPQREVFAPAQAYLRRMAIVAAVVVLVGALGAWWGSRRITTPLRDVTMAAEAIATGDLGQRVPVRGKDELGRLARSFNVMATQIARSLHHSEALLRGVTETAHDAIVAADAEGIIRYWNPGATRIFGYAADEVVGKPLTILMPPRYRDAHLNGISRYVQGGEAVVVGRTVELEGRRKDGGEFPIELSLGAARFDEGISFTGVIRDITERKRVEAALLATNAELEAFSYSVSHDLRAPLRAIHGFARILLDDHGPQLDAEAKRLLAVIGDNTQRMGRLIDELLAFSRLGRKEVETSRVDMQELVRGVAEEVRRGEGDRALDIAIGALPPARGDRALLRQAVANLLQNAAKFTRGRPEARIEVGYRPDGDQAGYYVRDNGAGFDQRYAGKLFGVFQRLHSAEEFEGTGVGLAIVQRIVQRHGGRVWAEGQVDQGATFYLTLPLSEE